MLHIMYFTDGYGRYTGNFKCSNGRSRIGRIINMMRHKGKESMLQLSLQKLIKESEWLGLHDMKGWKG